MSEEVEAKVKALFPENVEGIYISKNDYDRLYGDLTLENINLKQEIERLNKECDTYMKIATKRGNIIKEAIEYINECIKGNYFRRYDDEVYKMCDELLEILDKGEIKWKKTK